MQALKIEWDKLKLFYQIAPYPSFNQAAEALSRNQSSISRTMQILEQQLQCQLFMRSSKGLTLTPAGEILLKAVKHAMLIIQSAIIETQKLKD